MQLLYNFKFIHLKICNEQKSVMVSVYSFRRFKVFLKKHIGSEISN